MEKLQYKLENFEGPMDLLLFLISKHKLNIHDIEIFTLVEQYTDYVRQMEEADMDVASEFIEMAARLVYIKTVSLLPVHEDEGEKLREELSGELIEYAKCKEVAAELAGHTEGFDYFERPPMKLSKDETYKRRHTVQELFEHYLDVLNRGKKLPPPIENFGEIISKKVVSVRQRISYICKTLTRGKKKKLKELYSSSKSVSELVATFLAVLELVKENRLQVASDSDSLVLVGDGENIDFESDFDSESETEND